MKGQDSYQSKIKSDWRAWAWNCIIAMFPEYRRSMGSGARAAMCAKKIGIYLPGPEDNDRNVALAKGFREENLIGIDIAEKRIVDVRRAGGIGIAAKLSEVIMTWPTAMQLDFVFADLCSGMTGELAAQLTGLYHRNAASTICAFNLLRGRDPLTNQLQKGLNVDGLLGDDAKNRAAQLVFACRACFDDYADGPTCLPVAELRSYRSPESGQYFDSIVFAWPEEWTMRFAVSRSESFRFNEERKTWAGREKWKKRLSDGIKARSREQRQKFIARIEAEYKQTMENHCTQHAQQCRRRFDATARKTAAMRAVRTMKMKGGD